MDKILNKELNIPSKYLQSFDGRTCATVHKTWLSNLQNIGPINFLIHDKFSMDEIAAQPTLEELGSNWTRVYIKVYQKKFINTIPLPRDKHSTSTKVQPDLTFSQLLKYISETNYRNLWKEAHKKYSSSWNLSDSKDHLLLAPNTNDVAVMREVLSRIYNCPIIHVENNHVNSISQCSNNRLLHCNLLPVIFAVETASAFIIFYEQTATYSLQECVMYSPAALSTGYSKPLFIVYQLLKLTRDLFDSGLALGEIILSDILLMDNYTIQVLPKLDDNIYTTPFPRETKPFFKTNCSPKLSNLKPEGSTKGSDFGLNEKISELCEMWIYNQLSNFDYLTALNNLAGRRYGDPRCHHIMPWVTDFTSRSGKNWRDLTKSKFRLNKGDRQLDLTFDSQTSEISHHVSDVLSEITYYVYLSRRYEKSVLCKHVRSNWVPWEYPASIQRLQEWSPDECIPQFFTDPSVFKSIHEDLPDLDLPNWARSPEDFIEKHREALESFYVSERLHHWIDLTFGYKLSGNAAIKSKNVCLQLVDNHTSLTNFGVVQLFTQPHPQKIVPSLYTNKSAPRLHNLIAKAPSKVEKIGERMSDEEEHNSGFDEVESPIVSGNITKSSSLALSRFLSRSRGSLLTGEENNRSEKITNQNIQLPKDYNPIGALNQIEITHLFINKISHHIYKPKNFNQNELFNCRQIITRARIKEQKILGCLITEIFLSYKFNAIWNNGKVSFAQRLKTCINILKQYQDIVPKCIRNAISLLLQINLTPKSYNFEFDNNIHINDDDDDDELLRYPTITMMGLPPPSSHQFLQPVLSNNLFPSIRYFKQLFNIVQMINEYNSLISDVNKIFLDDGTGEIYVKIKMEYLCKISECKVKSLARELDRLFSLYSINSMESDLQLIIPHIKQTMEESYTAVLAVWYLFDPIAKALGPKSTAEIFLPLIVKLFESGSLMDNVIYSDYLSPRTLTKFQTMRLYHRSFLLKLMIRLGHGRFLENFITPLVEAVACYHNYPQTLLSISNQRTGNLKSCNLNESSGDSEMILSPFDEDSSIDSEQNLPFQGDYTKDNVSNEVENDIEETVFTMETENEMTSPVSENTKEKYTKDPNLALNLNLNLIEDLIDESVKSSPPSGSVKSPTIPIPKSSEHSTKLITDFNSIGCNVGSKNSNEDSSCLSSNIQSSSATVNNNSQENNFKMNKLKSVILKINSSEISDEELDEKKNPEIVGESKVSEISAESIIWLSHRLGPVLTARFLTRNLLRMLTICYGGKQNLLPTDPDLQIDKLHWKSIQLVGDVNSAKVLECLASIAALYGEQMIILQYFGHMTELLALCKRKLTPNLEGGLISCLALLSFIIPSISDTCLMDCLHEIIVKSILHPSVRILSTTRYVFPNGAVARIALANKFIEALFNLNTRLGNAATKSHLSVTIQRFFLIFDKIFGESTNLNDQKVNNESIDKVNDMDINSYSPPIADTNNSTQHIDQAFEELKSVFTIEFAHKVYLLLYRNVDECFMEQVLKNHQLIRHLCEKYEESVFQHLEDANKSENTYKLLRDKEEANVKGFGSISVIGNRINVGDNLVENVDEVSSSGRELRGNWLAYWEHEIGRPDKDLTFNIKQIKLQSFNGHTNSIRCLSILNNENSFMSGSRDKTVKLWSIRSQGDGSTVSSCQYTYTGHKKSILALAFLESLRYAVTCDGVIHCWDPFMGSLLSCPESSKPVPVNTFVVNSTSSSLLVATTDMTLRIIDCRTFQYVNNEMKISMNPASLIRCIAVAPSGHWVALGQSSGYLTVLDIRTGLIIASWKGHECEILQLQTINETSIISSSLDQTIAVWSTIDGKLKFHLKGAIEPVHCMEIYENQLISGTTANKIGIHTPINSTALYSSSKLRSDVFKGILTTMTILPLNRLLLLGADNGGITLFC